MHTRESLDILAIYHGQQSVTNTDGHVVLCLISDIQQMLIDITVDSLILYTQ